MATPNTLNARIALAKGWTWREKTGRGWVHYAHVKDGTHFSTSIPSETHWLNPQDEPAMLPDYVDTLAGVAGLLRELADAPEGMYMLAPQADGWLCAVAGGWKPSYFSPPDRPGDCVGEAWLSVCGKESDA